MKHKSFYRIFVTDNFKSHKRTLVYPEIMGMKEYFSKEYTLASFSLKSLIAFESVVFSQLSEYFSYLLIIACKFVVIML